MRCALSATQCSFVFNRSSPSLSCDKRDKHASTVSRFRFLTCFAAVTRAALACCWLLCQTNLLSMCRRGAV